MCRRQSLQSLTTTSSKLGICAMLACMLGGCVTEPVAPPRKLAVPAASAADACSDNMHNLSGYLLQYYFLHREFPEHLADLQPLVDVDHRFSLVCPGSGNTYLYFPSGLVAPEEKRRLVVVDADAVHAGGRWAIVATPAEGTQPVALWVIRIDEPKLKQYQASSPQP